MEYDPATVEPRQLVEAVEGAGYEATLPPSPDLTPADPGSAQPSEETAANGTSAAPADPLRQRLLISAVLSAPVLVLSMAPPLQFDYWQWLALQLATPVVIWGGWPFHRAAWLNLRHGDATMDTLVSLGTLAAWLWSLYALFLGDAGMTGMTMDFTLLPASGGAIDEIYLEVAAVVTTFLLAGRYFEARAKRQRRRRADRPARARRQGGRRARPDGEERRVPIEQLAVGDRFVVRPGERVATDGIVEQGRSALDMSCSPASRRRSRWVRRRGRRRAPSTPAGGWCVRATRVGADTALAQIARLVTEAQSGKAPVQRLADRVVGRLRARRDRAGTAVLAGWLIAGEDAAVAFTAAVAVLIVACPCALGLATPTALLVGTGRGAQLGMLIKGPEVLESTRRVDTVVLDKTGTVTTGRMSLVAVTLAPASSEPRRCGSSAAVEDALRAPIARAIADAARRRRSASCHGWSRSRTARGSGVEGVVERDGASWSAARTCSPSRPRRADGAGRGPPGAEARGHTAVAGRLGRRGRGRCSSVADTVKPTSAACGRRAARARAATAAGDRRQPHDGARPSRPRSGSAR